MSNHISWLDIFLINSIYPVTFLSKASVSKWPLIGLIIDGHEYLFNGECLGEITKNKIGLDGFGYDPIFIPEGFATDGSKLLPFKSNFFQTAINCSVMFITNYYKIFISKKIYLSSIDASKNILSTFNLIKLDNIEANLNISPQIKSTSDRKELARKAYDAIDKFLD